MNQTVRDTLERVVFAYIRVKYGNILFQKDVQARREVKELIGQATQSVPEAEATRKLSNIEEKLELEDQLALQVLIAMSQKKNIKAFEIVKERFMGATVKLIKEHDYHVDNNKNYTEIEETAQKAWIKIWKGLDKYDPQKGQFYTWMRTITIRLIKTSENQTLGHTDHLAEVSDSDEAGVSLDTKAHNLSHEAFRSPEIIFRDEIRGEWILQEAFHTRNGYPWQLLVFNLRSMQKAPRQIVCDHADDPLEEIAECVKNDLLSDSILESEKIEQILVPLQKAMNNRLTMLIPDNDAKTKESLKDFMEEITQAIDLHRFFGANPAKNISDWCARVRKRIRKNLNVNWR